MIVKFIEIIIYGEKYEDIYKYFINLFNKSSI
jgi:hypothetical protein